jgi:hypothetical protein
MQSKKAEIRCVCMKNVPVEWGDYQQGSADACLVGKERGGPHFVR